MIEAILLIYSEIKTNNLHDERRFCHFTKTWTMLAFEQLNDKHACEYHSSKNHELVFFRTYDSKEFLYRFNILHNGIHTRDPRGS